MYSVNKLLLFTASLLFLGLGVKAQTASDSSLFNLSSGIFPKTELPKTYKWNLSGFYRFFGTYTQQDLPYALTADGNNVVNPRSIFIGDDSQLPNLMLNISGRPNDQFSWGFDLFAFQFLNGVVQPAYSGQVSENNRPTVFDPLGGTRLGSSLGLNLGLNIFASYASTFGTFNLRLGGIHWYSISDLTLASFKGYYRWTLNERAPWDPIGVEIGERYNALYESGEVFQDTRFGERAVQGFIGEALALPGGWNVSMMYGKTELNGGFLSIPNNTFGGKIKKTFGSNWLAFNSLNGLTYIDTNARNSVGFQVHTLEGHWSHPLFTAHLEGGIGNYTTPTYTLDWGEAINLKFTTSKKISLIPIEIQAFRVSPNVVNNNALYWNVAVSEIPAPTEGNTNIGSGALLRPFASSVLPLGLLTNNRQGLNLNSQFAIGRVKLSLGLGAAAEIEAISNQITFSHAVNQLTRSRFWRWDFPQNIGPYGRQSVIYRDVFETVQLNDDQAGQPIHRKHFSTLEAHVKYKTNSIKHPLYVFFLGRYQSVQKHWSMVPVVNPSPYLRLYSNELEAFWKVRSGLYANAYAGYERSLGNYATDIDVESYRPRDQEGWGLGLGFDQSLGPNAGIFFRHRWFYFQDKSFALDHFQGQETLIELKVFF